LIKNGNSQRTRLRRVKQNGGKRVVDQSSHSVTNCYNLVIGYKFKCPYISI